MHAGNATLKKEPLNNKSQPSFKMQANDRLTANSYNKSQSVCTTRVWPAATCCPCCILLGPRRPVHVQLALERLLRQQPCPRVGGPRIQEGHKLLHEHLGRHEAVLLIELGAWQGLKGLTPGSGVRVGRRKPIEETAVWFLHPIVFTTRACC